MAPAGRFESASDLTELVEQAAAAPTTSTTIRRLASLLEDFGEASDAIDAALDANQADAAARLMMAAFEIGQPPTADQAARVIPFTDRIGELPVLIGCCTGNTVEMLLDLLERGQMSMDRSAMAMLIAAESLEGDTTPPRMAVQLRLLCRRPGSDDARTMLGVAAQALIDDDCQRVAADCIYMAEIGGGDVLAENFLTLMSGPPSRVLPSHEPPRVTSGFTVRRAVDKIGRNEPCPCGSGKKYKQCCLRKDTERLSDPSPVAGLTMAEYRARAGEHMDPDEFSGLRPREMRELDLSSLPTPLLYRALDKFTLFHFWAEAESALDVMADRDDLPDTLDNYRIDLIDSAVEANEIELAARQADLIDDSSGFERYWRLGLELAQADDTMLAKLEQAALDSLAEDADDRLCVPYSLFPSHPALGILCARGHLDPDRELDSAVLLQSIEEARDRLQLPPGDPSAQQFDLLADRLYDNLLDDVRTDKLTARNEALFAEVEEVREQLKQSTASSRELERSLRDASCRLAVAEAEAAAASSALAQSEPHLRPEADVDPRALRQKVDDLKMLVSQGNEDRAALRKQLASVRSRLTEVEDSGDDTLHSPKAGQQEVVDSLELDTEERVHTSLLVPQFTKRAAEALQRAPRRRAQAAVVLASRLAAGEEAPWQRVKHLREAPGVLSARVGIMYRLLFEIDDKAGDLVVDDFIHRSDLEKALQRYH